MTQERHNPLGLHDFHLHDPVTGAHVSRPKTLRRTGLLVLLCLVLLGLGAARALLVRKDQALAAEAVTAEQTKTYVKVTRAKRSDPGAQLVLPGTLLGMVESPVYARSTGYVKAWYKDIGAAVKKGDLLAEIDTPEVDQQLHQAVASRQQLAASLDLAKSSFERWQSLRKRDVVSQQELDERSSAYTQAQSNVAAAEANVRRLRELEGFKRITAPFDGIVTRRNVNVGDLVDAGSSGSGSRALFQLSMTNPLRLYVYVPQAYSQQVHVGDVASVTEAELPGQVFRGSVVRTAGAIDMATRTLQIEINLNNDDGRLLPGAYVQVAFPTVAPDALIVPTNAVLFRAEGPRIAVVDAGGKVKLHPVSIGRDFGRVLEILQGVSVADTLVLNPPDALADDDQVVVVQPQERGAREPAAKSPS
jgi:RND family efflux transporter MFP subunit